MILVQTNNFIRDSKKIKMSDKHFTKFVKYLAQLANAETLPKEAKERARNNFPFLVSYLF